MTVPNVGGQPGVPNLGQPQQQNGPGHVPMPPGMGAFDSQIPQPGNQGFPVSALPPVQQQPGQQFQQPRQQQQVPQQQQMPVQQGPVTYYPQQGQPPQQQQAPVQQQAPQQQQQAPQQQQVPSIQITAQTILDGPDIPAELRGRTWGEALSIYQGLRQVTLQQMNQQRPGVQQQAPVQQAPVQQQQAPVQQPGTQQVPAQASEFFRDPAGTIRRIVQEVAPQAVMPLIQPLLNQNFTQGVQQIHGQIAREMGQDWPSLEPRVLQLMGGLDSNSVLNPGVWRIAVQTALGERVMAQRTQQQQGNQQRPVQQQPVQQGYTPAGYFPVQQQQGNPLPNLGSFFTEQPGQAPAAPGGAQLTAQEQYVARQMGMDDATYASWKGGVQPQGGRR